MLGSARPIRGLGSVLLAAIVLSRCSNAAVSKAVGTAGDTAAPILIEASSTTITVANHAGRPLLDVRISLETAESQQPFLGVIPTIDTGATGSLALDSLRTEDGTVFSTAAGRPRQVKVAARDTLAKSYDASIPWTE